MFSSNTKLFKYVSSRGSRRYSSVDSTFYSGFLLLLEAIFESLDGELESGSWGFGG